MPHEAAALTAWRAPTPLLVLASHEWSTTADDRGELLCSSSRQAAVLRAAGSAGGGGALLLVLDGTAHNTCADVLPLLSRSSGWLLGAAGLAPRLDPALGLHLVAASTLAFLSCHLPLSAAQRARQSWAPNVGNGGGLLGRIGERDLADSGKAGGLLSHRW